MILSHINVSSLTKTDVNLSVELATAYFHVGFCNDAVKIMAGE
jgi:hypothetical protein